MEPRRDRWGRPIIITPEGAEESYTRATTFASCMDDLFAIGQWKQRMTAIGVAQARETAVAVLAAHAAGDKKRLNEICEQAMEASGANLKRDLGTALHQFCQAIDLGLITMAGVPEEHKASLEAYKAALEGYQVLDVEQFGVLDSVRVAGTWDRTLHHPTWELPRIADLKTGDIGHALGTIALQMTVYSRCLKYDPATNTRTDHAVDREKAVIIHLPAGGDTCTLWEIDLDPAGCNLAAQVRAWRTAKRGKTQI